VLLSTRRTFLVATSHYEDKNIDRATYRSKRRSQQNGNLHLHPSLYAQATGLFTTIE
jgi:hypothetical protein